MRRTPGLPVLLRQVLLVLLLATGLVAMHALSDRMATTAHTPGMSMAAQAHRPDSVSAHTQLGAAGNGLLADSNAMWECIAVLLVITLLSTARVHAFGRPRPGVTSTALRAPTRPRFHLLLRAPVLRI